jgi:hypothetical protein
MNENIAFDTHKHHTLVEREVVATGNNKSTERPLTAPLSEMAGAELFKLCAGSQGSASTGPAQVRKPLPPQEPPKR